MKYVCPFLSSLSLPAKKNSRHACGENPDRRYSLSRMDASWNFRNAYNQARKLLRAQDEFCANVENGDWDAVGSFSFEDSPKGEFPEDLKWEALVDVLRGRVKVRLVSSDLGIILHALCFVVVHSLL